MQILFHSTFYIWGKKYIYIFFKKDCILLCVSDGVMIFNLIWSYV